ncbi:MAG: ABC transporter ATP-binding protein [Rhodobiaceae bacterium]|nr:ABC transporter ATP-binding protein [Rhodobiaceae bacterium]MCC0057054.1 ABC transporter ATP-binding protein [Rhodobiaceae bacterium]
MPGWGRRGTAAASIASSLAFDGVSHRYGETVSLNDVTFQVSPGEVLCLLGRSGCGKSTLLRVATGLERPFAGTVSIDGKPVSDERRFVAPDKRGIGYVFQDYALFPHLTILENAVFGLSRLPRNVAKAEAVKALARVGMDSYQRAYPHQLSGGEQQRVALARAIAPRPGILLMDEPFSGLDRRLRDEVREETLAVLRETRATSIIVTHDPEEAMLMADRIALMRKGRIVQIGTAQNLYHEPADIEVAKFFSEINLLEGQGGAGFIATPLGSLPYESAQKGAAYAVGVRPHGIRVAPAGEGGTAGRIVMRRFSGEDDYLEIVVEGIDRPLVARARLSPGVVPGNDVSLSVDPHGILVFEDNAGIRG